MLILILWCATAALIGFALGYFIAWLLADLDRLFDAYMDGMGTAVLYWPAEVWR